MNSMLIHQIKRFVQLKGKVCAVTREELDEKKQEATGNILNICSPKGVYHDGSGYLRFSQTESGNTVASKQPKFLVLFEDVSNDGIIKVQKQDILTTSNGRYKVVGVDNLAELNIVIDLSLEVI